MLPCFIPLQVRFKNQTEKAPLSTRARRRGGPALVAPVIPGPMEIKRRTEEAF